MSAICRSALKMVALRAMESLLLCRRPALGPISCGSELARDGSREQARSHDGALPEGALPKKTTTGACAPVGLDPRLFATILDQITPPWLWRADRPRPSRTSLPACAAADRV